MEARLVRRGNSGWVSRALPQGDSLNPARPSVLAATVRQPLRSLSPATPFLASKGPILEMAENPDLIDASHACRTVHFWLD